MPITDLQRCVAQLIEKHGGVRAAGRAISLDPTYLGKLRDGDRDNPSDKVLRKLGLRRIETLRPL